MQEVMLAQKITEWASETKAIIDTCIRLAEYFGTDEEEASFRLALALPTVIVEAIQDSQLWASPPLPTQEPPYLACEEPLARMVSPLLQLVCEPVPEFLIAARSAPDPNAKQLVTLFGVFSGTFARHVCAPVWRAYPALAPEGWLL